MAEEERRKIRRLDNLPTAKSVFEKFGTRGLFGIPIYHVNTLISSAITHQQHCPRAHTFQRVTWQSRAVPKLLPKANNFPPVPSSPFRSARSPGSSRIRQTSRECSPDTEAAHFTLSLRYVQRGFLWRLMIFLSLATSLIFSLAFHTRLQAQC